jgi:type VI secretion system protein ImpG
VNDKKFLNYYHDELLSLRVNGGAFAKRHPEVAHRLDFKNEESTDPHTERIIEAVAYMSARLHQKIDDNAQHMAFHLLSALYPSLVNTFPPCGIVRFTQDSVTSYSDKIFIPKNTKLVFTPATGNSCNFQTLYPLTIYPIRISPPSFSRRTEKWSNSDGPCLSIEMMSASVPFENLDIQELLFCIHSEILEDALLVYQAIFSNPNGRWILKLKGKDIEIDRRYVVQCGFGDNETVCPLQKFSTNSLQILQEVLHFPRKFMFFKITNFQQLILESKITDIDVLYLSISLSESNDRFPEVVKKVSFVADATPIANLFRVTSDPFRFDGTKNKYLLIADQNRDSSLEINSVLNLNILDAKTRDSSAIPKYFSLTPDSENDVASDIYWTFSKESAETRGLDGNDTYISFVDVNMNPKNSYDIVAYAETLCTNRFETRDIQIQSVLQAESVETGRYSAKLLHKMTKPAEITEEKSTLWILISCLATTHITLASGEHLLSHISKLVEILTCNSRVQIIEMINQITAINVDSVVRRIGKEAWRGFVSGLEINIHTKSDYNFGPLFLFCNVLNRYLSAHVSINSFVELKVVSEMDNKEIARWLPTSGNKCLI